MKQEIEEGRRQKLLSVDLTKYIYTLMMLMYLLGVLLVLENSI